MGLRHDKAQSIRTKTQAREKKLSVNDSENQIYFQCGTPPRMHLVMNLSVVQDSVSSSSREPLAAFNLLAPLAN